MSLTREKDINHRSLHKYPSESQDLDIEKCIDPDLFLSGGLSDKPSPDKRLYCDRNSDFETRVLRALKPRKSVTKPEESDDSDIKPVVPKVKKSSKSSSKSFLKLITQEDFVKACE